MSLSAVGVGPFVTVASAVIGNVGEASVVENIPSHQVRNPPSTSNPPSTTSNPPSTHFITCTLTPKPTNTHLQLHFTITTTTTTTQITHRILHKLVNQRVNLRIIRQVNQQINPQVLLPNQLYFTQVKIPTSLNIKSRAFLIILVIGVYWWLTITEDRMW